MKNLRLMFILVCVFAVVVATADTRDGGKPEKAKVEQKAPEQERTDTRAKPAEKSESSSQKAYTTTKPNSSERKSNTSSSTWSRDSDRDRDKNTSDWNRTWSRDRNNGGKPDKGNYGAAQKTYPYAKPNSSDQDRDRNYGDWNRTWSRDRDPNDGGKPEKGNYGTAQKTYPYANSNSSGQDRDKNTGDWNRAWNSDRGDNRSNLADKTWRDDRQKRYDNIRHPDAWWQHHRYAQKAYGHDASYHRPIWHIDWGRPYYGMYYDRWHYIPQVNVVYRSDRQPPLLGSAVVAYDDTFLGIVSRDWKDVDSISNPYSRFGCPESPWSIWNTDGQWGNAYSFDSAWNPYATRPPRVYSGDYFLGYLTVNDDLYPRIDPYWLMDYLDIWVMD